MYQRIIIIIMMAMMQGGQDQQLRYAILRSLLVLRLERRPCKLSIEFLHKSQLFADIFSTKVESALVFRVAYY